jgi:GT2 family glycosyltransferase
VADFEVILMVYKSRQVLAQYLSQIGGKVPILVVDNSYEEDDISDLLAGYDDIRHVDSGGNIGFSAAANVGAEASQARTLIFMNPDTAPTPDALRRLADYLDKHPEVGAVGVAGVGTAGGGAQPGLRRLIAHMTGWFKLRPLSGIFYEHLHGRTVDAEWIAGSCLAIRRNVFSTVGGWDPFYFIYMSDFDLGLRLMRHGYRMRILGDVVIPHEDGGSSDLPSPWTWERRARAWVRFFRRTRRAIPAIGLTAILVAGHLGRAVAYTVRRDENRGLEQRIYVRSLLSEWIRPTSPGI